jgi:hypothetical protein
VSKRWALIVAAGNPQYPGIGGPSHADADAAAFVRAFADIGIPASQQVVQIGPQATLAVVESRIRSLAKRLKRGDVLLVYWGTRAFSVRDRIRFACWDTLPDDLQGTTIDVADAIKTLSRNLTVPIQCWFDCTSGPPLPGATEVDFTTWNDPETICGFASCQSNELSMAIGKPLHGIWSSLILDAFSGMQLTARDDCGRLTAHSLDAFIRQEFPRKLRAAFGPGMVQTPVRFGRLDNVVIDEAGNPSGGQSNEYFANDATLARIAFRGETRSKVKDLAGYRKSFAVPEHASTASNKFIARLARNDVDRDLRDIYDRVIRDYGYKRKELSIQIDRDGIGTLRTPDLEYIVAPKLDPVDPANIIWHREIGQFSNLTTIRTPAFDSAFGKLVDRLVFTFDAPLDVTAWIDRLEDHPVKGLTLMPAPDGRSCELRIQGMAGSIHIETNCVTVRGRPGSPNDLLISLFSFFERTGSHRNSTSLPATRRT